jgi:putative transposase
MFNLLSAGSADEDTRSMLDELCQQGAAKMLAIYLEAEVADYVDRHSDDLDQDGHRLVVRNGRGKARKVTTVSGTIEVRAPRVDDRRMNLETGERSRFVSAILPPWCRRSPGLNLHPSDHEGGEHGGQDRWISGRHAAMT